MEPQFLHVMVKQPVSSKKMFKLEWSELISQSQYQWLSTVLVVGNVQFLKFLNVHGNDGVRFYTRMKTVTSRWYASVRLEHHESSFTMPTME